MNNLMAYIPVLNKQYLDWLYKRKPFKLFLVDENIAGSLLTRLSRNMVALSAVDIYSLLVSVRSTWFATSSVNIFHPNGRYPDFSYADQRDWIMPDEDICRLFTEKYLAPQGCRVQFEQIWARWDMTAVKRQEPVIPDLEVSQSEIDIFRINEAVKLSQKSPDWWRQIGALVFRGDKLLACGWNRHYPTEYETYILGDTRLNFDAGDPAGMDAYVSLHAEDYVESFCARDGISLKGASWYLTDMPCGRCSRKIYMTEAKEVFFLNGYSMLGGYRILKAAGIRVVKVKSPEIA